MDKVEYRELIRSIKNKYLQSDYEGVIELANELELSKIRENSILEIIAKAYESLGRYDLAKDALLVAYKRTPTGKRIAYNLTILSIKLDDLDSAVMFYEDFCQMAPKDNQRLLLKYEIGRAGGIPIRDLIKVLEVYNEREMDDRWEYELARLYHEAGDGEKCAEACDQIILWYANGEYEKKALELKNMHKALTPSQQARYEEIMAEVLADTTEVRSAKAAEEEQPEPAQEPEPEQEQEQKTEETAAVQETEQESAEEQEEQPSAEEVPVPEAQTQPLQNEFTEDTEAAEDEDHIAGQLPLSAMLTAFQNRSHTDKEQSDKAGEDRAAQILAAVNESHDSSVLEQFEEEPDQDGDDHLEEVIEPEVPLLNREDTITPVDDGGTDLGKRAAEFAFEKEDEQESSEQDAKKEAVPQVEQSVDATQFIPVNQIAARIAEDKQETQEKLSVPPAVVAENPVYEEIDPGSAAGRVSVGSAADPGFSMEELIGMMQEGEKDVKAAEEEPEAEQGEHEAEDSVPSAPAFELDLIFGNNVAPVIKKSRPAEPVKEAEEEPELEAEEETESETADEAESEAEETAEPSEPDVKEEAEEEPEPEAAEETESEAEATAEPSEPEVKEEADEVPAAAEEEAEAVTESELSDEPEEQIDVEIVDTTDSLEVGKFEEFEDFEEEYEDEYEEEDSQKGSWKEALSSAGSKLHLPFFGRKKTAQAEMPYEEEPDDTEESEEIEELEESEYSEIPEEQEEPDISDYLNDENEYAAEEEEEESEVTGKKKEKRTGFLKSLLGKLTRKKERVKEDPEDEEYPEELDDIPVWEPAEETEEQVIAAETEEEPEITEIVEELPEEAEETVEEAVSAEEAAAEEEPEADVIAAETEEEPEITGIVEELPEAAEEIVEEAVSAEEAAAEEEPEADVIAAETEEEPEVTVTAAKIAEEPEITEIVEELPEEAAEEIVEEAVSAEEAAAVEEPEVTEIADKEEHVFEEDEERFEAFISLEDFIEDPELNTDVSFDESPSRQAPASGAKIRRGNKGKMTKAVPEIFVDAQREDAETEQEEDALEKARLEKAQMKEQKKAAKMALKAQKQAMKAQKIREKAQRLAEEQAARAKKEEEEKAARAKREEEEKAAREAQAQKEAEEKAIREALARKAAEDEAAKEAAQKAAKEAAAQEQARQQRIQKAKAEKAAKEKADLQSQAALDAQAAEKARKKEEKAARKARARKEAQKPVAPAPQAPALDMDELLAGLIQEKPVPKHVDSPMSQDMLDALLTSTIKADTNPAPVKTESKPRRELKTTSSGEFDLDDFIRQDTKKKETRQMSFDDLFGGEFRPKVHIPDAIQTPQAAKKLEVNKKYKLNHEQRKAMGEFLLIEGMEEEIEGAIENLIIKKKSGDDTGGHMIVTGDAKSGKTFLTVEILKAVNQEIGHGNPRVAKVQAQAINGKSVRKVLEKVAGSDLIIENIGKLEDDTVRDLITAVRENNASTMVILEGNELAAENMILKFPDIAQVFKTRVDIGELTLTQWSDLAQRYAKGQGYYIDREALLALHAKIDEISTSDMRLGLSEVKRLVDDAIEKAEKQKTGKLFSAFSKKTEGNLIPLTEENFM